MWHKRLACSQHQRIWAVEILRLSWYDLCQSGFSKSRPHRFTELQVFPKHKCTRFHLYHFYQFLFPVTMVILKPQHPVSLLSLCHCQNQWTHTVPTFTHPPQSGTRGAKNRPNLKGGEQTTLGSSIRKKTMRRKGRDKEEWKGWMHEAYLIWQKWVCKSL